MGLLVRPEIIDDTFEDASLADRPALVWARIAPGMKAAIEVKDADIHAVERQQFLVAVGKVGEASNLVFGHAGDPWLHRFRQG